MLGQQQQQQQWLLLFRGLCRVCWPVLLLQQLPLLAAAVSWVGVVKGLLLLFWCDLLLLLCRCFTDDSHVYVFFKNRRAVL
jgi:hypothetical protein